MTEEQLVRYINKYLKKYWGCDNMYYWTPEIQRYTGMMLSINYLAGYEKYVENDEGLYVLNEKEDKSFE